MLTFGRRGPGCGCLGCGGSSLLVLVVLAALAWFIVIKPVKDFLASWQSPPATTQQVPTSTPAQLQAPLTKAEVQQFVRVRREVRKAFGTNFQQLQESLNQLQQQQNPNLLEIVDLLRKTSGSIGSARQAQTAALAQEGLSRERYAVIRSAVNRVLGLPNVDFAKIAQGLQTGQLPDLNGTVQLASPQEKQLIGPFERELRVSAAAGLLGL